MIKSIVIRDFNFVVPYASVESVKEQLLKNRYVVVGENGVFAGLLTPADVIQRPHKLIADCITKKPGIQLESGIDTAIDLMEKKIAPGSTGFFRKKLHWYRSLFRYTSIPE